MEALWGSTWRVWWSVAGETTWAMTGCPAELPATTDSQPPHLYQAVWGRS